MMRIVGSVVVLAALLSGLALAGERQKKPLVLNGSAGANGGYGGVANDVRPGPNETIGCQALTLPTTSADTSRSVGIQCEAFRGQTWVHCAIHSGDKNFDDFLNVLATANDDSVITFEVDSAGRCSMLQVWNGSPWERPKNL